jgi:large conductance mechanosensitive channel
MSTAAYRTWGGHDYDTTLTGEDCRVPKVISEFKDFITRGNVIDLAVAVVVGSAFTAIVNALVEGILTPLVGMFFGEDFTGMTFTINNSTFSYGLVINAVIYFAVVAAAIFFLVVKPLNVLNERFRRGEDAPAPSPPTDEAVLLAEIRDLLRAQANGDGRSAAPVPPAGPVPPPPGPTRPAGPPSGRGF